MQFGNNWPGVFVRGDHTLAAAAHLEMAIRLVEKMSSAYWPTMSVLTGLLEGAKVLRRQALAAGKARGDRLQWLRQPTASDRPSVSADESVGGDDGVAPSPTRGMLGR
jgi:hypothetical protein